MNNQKWLRVEMTKKHIIEYKKILEIVIYVNEKEAYNTILGVFKFTRKKHYYMAKVIRKS